MEYGPTWFKYNYKPEWLKDGFVQDMIRGVDNSVYVDGLVIDSPVLVSRIRSIMSSILSTLI